MDSFHDLFGADEPDDTAAGGPTEDALEHSLRLMLERRSADISEPSRLRVAIDADGDAEAMSADALSDVTPLPLGTGSDHRPPGGWLGSLLAAAAVVVLGAGSVLAVHSLKGGHHPAAVQPSPTRPAPTATPSPSGIKQQASCPLPAGWRAAINAGSIKVDQPINQPLSADSTGNILMLQQAVGQSTGQTDFTHQELAIFDQAGHGTTIWQAADPAHDYVDVSPDSAISGGWVVFGLTRSQNLAAHGVAAWNRATGQLSTVRLQSTAEQAANQVIDFDPIVVGNTAYWIEQKFNDVAHQQLIAQPLPAGSRTSQPVSHVSRLIALGGGVALVHQAGQFVPGTEQGAGETLTAGPGLHLPRALASGATGTNFGTYAGVLWWLDRGALLSWNPGEPTIERLTLAGVPLGARPVGPFLVSDTTVLDVRNGALLRLNADTRFVLVSGPDLLVTIGTGKLSANQVHRVPLSSLTAASC